MTETKPTTFISDTMGLINTPERLVLLANLHRPQEFGYEIHRNGAESKWVYSAVHDDEDGCKVHICKYHRDPDADMFERTYDFTLTWSDFENETDRALMFLSALVGKLGTEMVSLLDAVDERKVIYDSDNENASINGSSAFFTGTVSTGDVPVYGPSIPSDGGKSLYAYHINTTVDETGHIWISSSKTDDSDRDIIIDGLTVDDLSLIAKKAKLYDRIIHFLEYDGSIVSNL